MGECTCEHTSTHASEEKGESKSTIGTERMIIEKNPENKQTNSLLPLIIFLVAYYEFRGSMPVYSSAEDQT